MDEEAVKQARILIVDDQEPNVALLERLFDVSDFTNVRSTTDSSQAVTLCAEIEPDLILLDLQMPAPDGFEVMGQLAPWIRGSTRLPILVLTADKTPETKRRALSMGATDFLSKPLDMTEVVLRVNNLLLTRLMQLELRDQNKLLEQRVRERTRDLEEARIEVLDRLAFAAEYRDDATGGHARRIGRVAALVARHLGLPEETVELIRRAAPLHDVGKLGISDSILLKQGKLTPEEFEVMKLHVSIGAEILGSSRSALLRMSEEIALAHHESWNGTGYPQGLKGEAIPITGRIVAVADTFDALTHRRADPLSPKQALVELRRVSGQQFDPQVVDAFLSLGLDVLGDDSVDLDLVA
jgi:putative two-component system response regulator